MGTILLDLTDDKQQNILRKIIREETNKVLLNFQEKKRGLKTYSVSETMKIINKGRASINKMIDEGILELAIDNKIKGSSINNYLQNNH
jgi:phosphoribosyl-ATP pyrophosphohydrolase